MKRALILCLFVLMGEVSGECATTMFPPLQPLQAMGGANPIQNYSSNNITALTDPFVNPVNPNYADIGRIEQSLFGRTFAGQNISMRLSRIEKSLFTTTYPNSTDVQRIDNIISNFNQINKYPNISKNELSKIESRVLNQTYLQNSPERRIERLEEQMFGAVQSGNINSRYEALQLAAKAYNRNNQYSSNNPSQIGQGGWKTLASNVGNSIIGNALLGNSMMGGSLMGGSMTGFTPPINPYNSYNNGYNNSYNRYNNYNSYANPTASGYGMYKGYRTNHGYYDGFQDYSSGAGVTILD